MCRVSAFRRDIRSEAAEGAASAQHGERRNETERRGGDMATRFIGGMSAEGLPEIAGGVPAAGGRRGGGHGPRAGARRFGGVLDRRRLPLSAPDCPNSAR